MNLQNLTGGLLIVDDDEDDFIITGEYISAIPGNKFQLHWSKNYEDGINKLLTGNYAICFVDYRLGARSGVDFLWEAQQHNSETPIVLLTGKGNYEVDIQAMQYGAVDYLVKPELSVEKMERCIRYTIERSAAMNALRANERKYRTIFEKSTDIVFLADKDLNFTDVNPAVQILEYSREEILSSNLLDHIEQSQNKQLLREAISNDKGVNDKEITLLTKNREKKYCILTLSFEDNTSSGRQVQGIIHDITNLKREEKAQLQSEKLAAAGRLVRTIAHEVRNPLNNISLSVEQMQHDVIDDQLRLYMDIIQRNSRRINDLISELLNTSRPTDTQLNLLVFQSLLDDVVAATIDRLTLKQIKLQLSYPDKELNIKADRKKLMLALLNIVTNAVESMEDKTGKLTVKLEGIDNKAVLTIADNGCGISEENVAHLFEPYFTQKRNGIGLGLTFTLNILQAHHANIDVTSEVGTGTTFTITFPTS